MTILSGQTIRRTGILKPCEEADKFEGVSHGLGPAGYDLRLVLPKDGEDVRVEENFKGQRTMELWPGDFALVAAKEYFDIPADVVAIVHDKSTWARRGLTVQNTVAEPGWRGWLTLELANHGKEVIELIEGQGIAQVIFHRTDEPVEAPYDGKYQDQAYGPQEARS